MPPRPSRQFLVSPMDITPIIGLCSWWSGGAPSYGRQPHLAIFRAFARLLFVLQALRYRQLHLQLAECFLLLALLAFFLAFFFLLFAFLAFALVVAPVTFFPAVVTIAG